ncbi:MAG: NUDIX domain-containing protein [Chloroflexi bacterium]|nr:NUDIX domain-containing protein [Chloroflexota bacterium]
MEKEKTFSMFYKMDLMEKKPQVILKNRYQVVPRTLILIINQEKVLLQKGSDKKKIYPGLYNGIGGHIERGEDVITSARRELKEESGITSADLRLVGTVAIDVNDSCGILMFVLSGTVTGGVQRDSEEGRLYWVDVKKIPKMNVVEDIPELVNKIQKLKTGEIFHAHYSYNPSGERKTTFGG